MDPRNRALKLPSSTGLKRPPSQPTTTPQGDGNQAIALSVGGPLPVATNHYPARGRKQPTTVGGSRADSSQPTTTPQGDGNEKPQVIPVEKSRRNQPLPRKGTEISERLYQWFVRRERSQPTTTPQGDGNCGFDVRAGATAGRNQPLPRKGTETSTKAEG